MPVVRRSKERYSKKRDAILKETSTNQKIEPSDQSPDQLAPILEEPYQRQFISEHGQSKVKR